MVFVYLCDETHELVHIAETSYFPKLAIFGETVNKSLKEGEEDEDGGGADSSMSSSSSKGDGPGDREMRIGRILPMLQVRQDKARACAILSSLLLILYDLIYIHIYTGSVEFRLSMLCHRSQHHPTTSQPLSKSRKDV